MRDFDNHDGNSTGRGSPWRNDDSGVILEGEIVGDNIHVAPPGAEPVWGVNAASFGRKLLIAMAVLAALVILVPLVLAFLALALIMALVGRLLLGRHITVTRWTRPWGARG
ncbi:hypothetical protein [Camelimonas lactis]|uniref:Uncharacterized protein n=1 Tax=Camelimonas lactis TaxID=659006 RepID=A0A4R2GUT5_9HYPH|nr:hypothetical protein [Camelimonas lactis]TCO13737.1 hypothetical protein EV666_105108 [Camelimonas lactis]